jgi:rhodanese-related sulfurtransferase
MEETSARVASMLMENGITNVEALQGGLRAWISAGYPIEK